MDNTQSPNSVSSNPCLLAWLSNVCVTFIIALCLCLHSHNNSRQQIQSENVDNTDGVVLSFAQ